MLFRWVGKKIDEDAFIGFCLAFALLSAFILLFSAMFSTILPSVSYDSTTSDIIKTDASFNPNLFVIFATVGELVAYLLAGLSASIMEIFTTCSIKDAYKNGLLPLVFIELSILSAYYAFDASFGNIALILISAISSIIVAEIIYWADPQKPDADNNRFWFTAKVKLESYIDVLFGWLIIGGVLAIVKASKYLGDAILTYGIYPLGALAIIGGIYGYIWLNSLKYRNTKPDKVDVSETKKSDYRGDWVKCDSCGCEQDRNKRATCWKCDSPLPTKATENSEDEKQ